MINRMLALLLYPSCLFALILTGAHYYWNLQYAFVIVCALYCIMLFSKKKWAVGAVGFFLFYACFEWAFTTYRLIDLRQSLGLPFLRAGILLWVVAFFHFLVGSKLITSLTLSSKECLQAIVFFISFIMIYYIDTVTPYAMLIAERFVVGSGAVQAFCLAFYGSWVFSVLSDAKKQRKYRLRIWGLFTFVFFLQLFLGVLGIKEFLLSGELHFPVPGFIVFGAVYKGSFTFMLGLLFVSLMLVGSSWCSHLCYFGSLDALAVKNSKEKYKTISISRRIIYRASILLLGCLIAVVLSLYQVQTFYVLLFSFVYIVIAISIIGFISRKYGVMVHCTSYCPIGLLANFVGFVSFWKLSVDSSCDNCKACEKVCKYSAITEKSRQKGKATFACTLCLDCTNVCKQKAISLTFIGKKYQSEIVKYVFIALVAVIHTIFMAYAKV